MLCVARINRSIENDDVCVRYCWFITIIIKCMHTISNNIYYVVCVDCVYYGQYTTHYIYMYLCERRTRRMQSGARCFGLHGCSLIAVHVIFLRNSRGGSQWLSAATAALAACLRTIICLPPIWNIEIDACHAIPLCEDEHFHAIKRHKTHWRHRVFTFHTCNARSRAQTSARVQ